MAKPVVMPQRGLSEESSIISTFYKNKGDSVKTGDAIFSIETDKTSFDVEADTDGVILEVFYNEGDEVPVLTNVCVIGQEGESIDEFRPSTNAAPVQPEVKEEEKISSPSEEIITEAVTETVTEKDGRVKISPRARHLAEKGGVAYENAAPTGPEGRIIERDILSLIEKGPIATFSAKDEFAKISSGQIPSGSGIGGRINTTDLSNTSTIPSYAATVKDVQSAQSGLPYQEIKLSNIRKIIAKNMHESLSSTAQLTLHASFDATDILNYRKKIKANKDKLGIEDISLNDMILFAVSKTLTNHKDLNAHFLSDKMLQFNNVHLGIAVDTEKGLMVPTIFNADIKSLDQISKESKAIIGECRKGTISPDNLKGASFTVTNLGTFDIEYFTPILNPPQVGILGVNTIVYRTKLAGDEYVNYPCMGLSLTFDHRATDGAPAARFLKELKTNLENFSILLCK